MIYQRGYKTELDLNNIQLTACLQHAGAARFAYNWGLQRRMEHYNATGKSLNAQELHKELNTLKRAKFPWMYEVSKCAMQEALRNLDNSFSHFFRRVRLKKQKQFKGKLGFPKFKRRHQGIGSFRLTGKIYVGKTWIQLPRLGKLKLKERGYLPLHKHILSATVSEHAGHWFVSILTEETSKSKPITNDVIGVDLGLKHMAVTSNGQVFSNLHPLKRGITKLKRLQRQLTRRQKGSHNRARIHHQLVRQHYRIASIRKNALHQVTSTLTAKTKPEEKRPSAIVLEDLNVVGMLKNPNLAQAIGDVGFGEFKQQMKYKTEWLGQKLMLADRFYPSTQTCSYCGRRRTVALTLRERVFECEYEDCLAIVDRDLNAALNLKQLYETTASSAESNACGEGVRPATVGSPRRNKNRVKL